MFAVPAERCFSTDVLPHRNHRIQRSLASRRRASGVEETEMREKARRKESGGPRPRECREGDRGSDSLCKS